MTDLVAWTWVTDEVRARYTAGGQWGARTWLDDLLEWRARAPGELAVVDAAHGVSVGDLLDGAGRVATFLRAQGVGGGDVIALLLPNWWEFAVVHAAVTLVGGVLNPMLPSLGPADIEHVLRRGRAKVVFAAAEHRGAKVHEIVHGIAATIEDGPVVVAVRSPQAPNLDAILERELSSLACDVRPEGADVLLFTSGTEGAPKGAVHSHQTSYFGLTTYLDHVVGLERGSSVFMPSPICHATGLQWGLRTAAHVNGPLVLQDRWDPTAALDLIVERRCAYTLAATPFIADLVHEQRRRGENGSTLRRIVSGGAPIPRELVTGCQEALGSPLLSVFGATETFIATATHPHDPLPSLLSDGSALPGTEVRVRADGEIVTRGPHVFAGYLDEEPSRRAFDGEWYRFGDIGILAGDGQLSVTGRVKDIVIRGGQNISVAEVEQALLTHPDVADVAIVGYADARLGERCCAVVVLRAGSTLGLSELTDHLRDRGLSTYKLPERLVIVDELPRTATGKVRKAELRTKLRDGGGLDAAEATASIQTDRSQTVAAITND